VGELSGVATDPPRQRLYRTVFHRIHPDEHDRIVGTVANGFMVEHASTFDKVVLEFLGLAERAYHLRVAEETQLDGALAG